MKKFYCSVSLFSVEIISSILVVCSCSTGFSICLFFSKSLDVFIPEFFFVSSSDFRVCDGCFSLIPSTCVK